MSLFLEKPLFLTGITATVKWEVGGHLGAAVFSNHNSYDGEWFESLFHGMWISVIAQLPPPTTFVLLRWVSWVPGG